MEKPTLVSSEIVHQNPWWRVRKDELIYSNGKKGTYFVHESNPFVIVVAIDKRRRMLFIEQYRPTTKRSGLEFPRGKIEPGESLLDAAKRELREETGCEGGVWREIGEFQNASGQCDHRGHIFLALDVEQTRGTELDDAEIGMTSHWVEEADCGRIMRTVHDGDSHIAWSFYNLDQSSK